MAKLLDIVLAFAADDLRAISAITIERAASGGWQARTNIFRNKFSHAASEVPGISQMFWERVPDQVAALDLSEISRDADMRMQVAAVQSSGLLGSLQLARYDRDDRCTSYLVKSHAGCQRERTAWLLGLQERPENTIYE